MPHAFVLMVSGGIAALVVILFAVVLVVRGRPGRAAVTARAVSPRSLIRLLTTEEELAEAARRAASFERWAAERATARATLYEMLAEPEATPSPAATVHDLGQRSAS